MLPPPPPLMPDAPSAMPTTTYRTRGTSNTTSAPTVGAYSKDLSSKISEIRRGGSTVVPSHDDYTNAQRRNSQREQDAARFQRYRRLLMEQELHQRRNVFAAPHADLPLRDQSQWDHRQASTDPLVQDVAQDPTDVVDAVTKHLLPPARSIERTEGDNGDNAVGSRAPVDHQGTLRPPSRSASLPPTTSSRSASFQTHEDHSCASLKEDGDSAAHWQQKYAAMREKCEVLGRRLIETVSASQKRELELCQRLRDERAATDSDIHATLASIEDVLLRECLPAEFAQLSEHSPAPPAGPSSILSKVCQLLTISQAVAAQRKVDAALAWSSSNQIRDALMPVKQQVSDATRVLFHLSRQHLQQSSSSSLPQSQHSVATRLTVSRSSGITENPGSAVSNTTTTALEASQHHHHHGRASPQPTLPPPSPTTRAVTPQHRGDSIGAAGSAAAIRYVPLDGTPDAARRQTSHAATTSGSATRLSSGRRTASATPKPVPIDVKSGSLLRELDGTPHDDGPFAKLRDRLTLRQVPVLPSRGSQSSARKSASPNPAAGKRSASSPAPHPQRNESAASTAASGSYEVNYFKGTNAPSSSRAHDPETRPSSVDYQECDDEGTDPSPRKPLFKPFTTSVAALQQSRARSTSSATVAAWSAEIYSVCDLLRNAFHELDLLTSGPKQHEGATTAPKWMEALQLDIRRLTATSLIHLQRFTTAAAHLNPPNHYDAAKSVSAGTLLSNGAHVDGDSEENWPPYGGSASGNVSIATTLFSRHHHPNPSAAGFSAAAQGAGHNNAHVVSSRNVSLESNRMLDIEEFFSDGDDDHDNHRRGDASNGGIQLYPTPEPLHRPSLAARVNVVKKRQIGFIPAPTLAAGLDHGNEGAPWENFDQTDHQQGVAAHHQPRRMVVSPMPDE